MKILGLILFRRLFMPPYSFVINCLYWCILFWRIGFVQRTRYSDDLYLRAGTKQKSLDRVRVLLIKFKWTKDRMGDWTPWIATLYARSYRDDCDGAATFGKWALNIIGIDSRLAELYNSKTNEGHMICISNDNLIIISNNDVHEADFGTEKRSRKELYYIIFDIFHKRYDVIIDGWDSHKLT